MTFLSSALKRRPLHTSTDAHYGEPEDFKFSHFDINL